MNLIIITGPHAVGKMSVGQELAKITGLKLFHNHMTIDILADLFLNQPNEFKRLKEMFREEVFTTFAKTDEYGLIFTYMWAFDIQEDWDYINHVEDIFKVYDAKIYFVELIADYDIRLERNKTENRLINKSTKRNLEQSELMFKNIEKKYRLNSFEGEIKKENYLRIDNTNINATEVAHMIKNYFGI